MAASKNNGMAIDAFPPGSLGEYIAMLYRPPTGADVLSCPDWPPDLFAIVGALLYGNGEYRRIIRPARSSEASVGTSQDWKIARSVGRNWRTLLNGEIGRQRPSRQLIDALKGSAILDWWNLLSENASLQISQIRENPHIVQALLMLFFASDEACEAIGMPSKGSGHPDGGQPKHSAIDDFIRLAQYYFVLIGDSRTLCLRVRPDLVRVLPKLHTAQVGLTLRSLSHNLALCRATGIDAFWNGPYPLERKNPDSLNLLLLPWPSETRAQDFGPIEIHAEELDRLAPNAGYFAYSPKHMSVSKFRARMENAIALAREHSDIHAVVFPELALNEAQYEAAEHIAWKHGLLLIAGVQVHDARGPQNLCAIQPLGIREALPHTKRRAQGLARRPSRRYYNPRGFFS